MARQQRTRWGRRRITASDNSENKALFYICTSHRGNIKIYCYVSAHLASWFFFQAITERFFFCPFRSFFSLFSVIFTVVFCTQHFGSWLRCEIITITISNGNFQRTIYGHVFSARSHHLQWKLHASLNCVFTSHLDTNCVSCVDIVSWPIPFNSIYKIYLYCESERKKNLSNKINDSKVTRHFTITPRTANNQSCKSFFGQFLLLFSSLYFSFGVSLQIFFYFVLRLSFLLLAHTSQNYFGLNL